MKNSLAAILIILITPCVAMGCGEEIKGTSIDKKYPITGMSLGQLNSFFDSVKNHINDKQIISVTIYNENCISINTGIMRGPLNGHGVGYTFEKNNKTWKLKDESKWIS